MFLGRNQEEREKLLTKAQRINQKENLRIHRELHGEKKKPARIKVWGPRKRDQSVLKGVLLRGKNGPIS